MRNCQSHPGVVGTAGVSPALVSSQAPPWQLRTAIPGNVAVIFQRQCCGTRRACVGKLLKLLRFINFRSHLGICRMRARCPRSQNGPAVSETALLSQERPCCLRNGPAAGHRSLPTWIP